jgi:hypothetical protein
MAYAPDPGALQRSLLTAGLGLLSNRSPTDLHTAILNSLRSQQQQGIPYQALQLLGIHPGGFLQPTYTLAAPPMVRRTSTALLCPCFRADGHLGQTTRRSSISYCAHRGRSRHIRASEIDALFPWVLIYPLG